MALRIEPATAQDVGLILSFIRELAEYERLLDQVVASEELLREQLFGERPGAEVVIARWDGEPAGFALFFHNFSTFLGKRGLYLEDLFVRPAFRGRGVGRALLAFLARVAVERGCGRLEWWVLDWNEPAIGFYRGLGAAPMSDWTVFRLTGEPLEALALSSAADMEAEPSEGRPHSRRGLSGRGQRVLWGALGGAFGGLAGVESGLASGGAEGVLGLAVGAAVGALLARQLSHALPLFGVVIGPAVALTLMNLQRFATSYAVSTPPALVGGPRYAPGASQAAPTPSLPYTSTAIGAIASALLAAVLLHALGRKIRGERRPLSASLRSLAWICFWITFVMILISNFAPI